MESYFDINVSLNGTHLFATHPRSIKDPIRAKQVTELFRAKFPQSAGFEVSCTFWECHGRGMGF